MRKNDRYSFRPYHPHDPEEGLAWKPSICPSQNSPVAIALVFQMLPGNYDLFHISNGNSIEAHALST